MTYSLLSDNASEYAVKKHKRKINAINATVHAKIPTHISLKA
jgi:hypothetical protein